MRKIQDKSELSPKSVYKDDSIIKLHRLESDEDNKNYQGMVNNIFENTIYIKYGLNFEQIKEDAFQFIAYYSSSGEKIGIFTFSPKTKTEATLDYIGILPKFRGTGTGSALLEKGIDLIKNHGFDKKIYLEIIIDDVNLFNFYIKNHFRVEMIKFYHYGKKGLNFEGSPIDFCNFIKKNEVFHLIPFAILSKKLEKE